MDSQTTQPTGPIYKATPPDFYNPPTPEEKGDGKVYKPSPDNDNNFESSSELLDKEDADDLMDNPFGFGGKDKAAIKRRNAAFSAFLEACGQDTWIGRLRYENVHFEGKTIEVEPTSQMDFEETYYQKEPYENELPSYENVSKAKFGSLYGTRSGDKGGCANLGVWAKNQESYSYLYDFLFYLRITLQEHIFLISTFFDNINF